MKIKVLRLIMILSKYTIYSIIIQSICYNVLLANVTFGQRQVLLKEIHISMKAFKNAPLEKVFAALESKTDFTFNYDKNDLMSETITLDKVTSEISLHDYLVAISKYANLKFKRIDENIHVSKRIRREKILTEELSGSIVWEKEISGKVTDENGDALPGVNVLVKGTDIGTITDAEGIYRLNVPDEAGTLVFSYVGYISEEVEISGRSMINIGLTPDISTLSEIVVVGFGTQESRKVVSSVAQISGEELQVDKRPVTSIQSALIGSVPGLRGLNQNGRPGSTPNFSIRGNSTLNDADILVIIDGFEGSLTDLDPQTVESVSILKDAAAVAVYGARGANGVMLITTKQTNRSERLSVSYSYNYSIQTPQSLPGTLNSLELMEFRNTAAGVGNEEFDDNALNLARSGFYPETVWPEELYRSNSGQQAHNLNVAGGTEKTGYLINASYLNQKGLVLGADDFQRLNLRFKIDTDINDWLSLGTNTLITNRITNQTPADGQDGLLGLPFFPVKTVDGIWVDKGSPGNPNPIAQAASGSFTKANRDALNLQLYAKVRPVKGLTIEERISFIKTNVNTRDWDNVFDYVTLDETDPDSYTNPDSPGRIYAFGSPDARTLNLASTTGYVLRTLTTLNYERNSGYHNWGVLLGFQSEEGESEGFNTGRAGFSVDNLIDLQLGNTNNINIRDVDPDKSGIDPLGNTSFRGGNATTLSYFGRLNYDFQGRYLAEFTFRVDGSSNFLDNNQYGFFPALALGWNMAEEPFFDNADFVDNLKLRASYGRSGDDSGVGRRVVQLVNLDVTGYPIGGSIQPRLSLGAPASRNLQWETATTLNLGLDFSLWEGKLQVNSEYFITRRDNILDEIITPVEFGLGNVPANLYEVKSWGWELEVTHENQAGQVNYWVSANITNYDNEITDLISRSFVEGTNFRDIGQSINNRFGYETDGFFDNQDEIDAYVGPDGATKIDQGSVGGTFIGGYKYVDQFTVDTDGDGIADARDGVITPDDRVVLEGNSATNLNIGINLGASYQGFSLFARFYGALDRNQWWNGAAAHEPFLNGTNAFNHQLDYWREDNREAIFPVPLGTGIQGYNSNVSHLLRNNEFIKLQNITLSYTFDQALLQKLRFVRGLSLVVSVENIGTVWTNSPAFDYGWDPELGVGEVDYPLPVTTSFGVNVKF